MDQLLNHIQANLPDVSAEALTIISDSCTTVDRKKGELLLEQGQICRHLYFLVEGMTRSFFVRDGNDITTWFSFRNDFITSFTSFFPKKTSYESIEMLSDGVLCQIGYEQLISDRPRSAEIERVINHFTVQYTIQLENRLLMLQTNTAAEKYQAILKLEPNLVRHIPGKHLASYLGITRETLSRIRSAIN